MIKSFKKTFLLFISFLFSFTLLTYSPTVMSDVNIIEDSVNTKILPRNFRKTSDISYIENIKYLNLDSLSNLNISGNNFFNDSITDTYIKNYKMPKYLYVISEDNMTNEEKTMIATLQGLISNKSEKQIYILSPSEPDYEIWLKDLKTIYNVKYKTIKDPWKLIDIFNSYIDGYVLYSNVKSPSINNACTLASLKNSVAIEESIESIINKHGITNLIQDCINTDKYWAYNNL